MEVPRLHYISQGKRPSDHLKHIEQACIKGAPLVQLRVKNVDQTTLQSIALEAREITKTYGVKLIINDDHEIAQRVQADGVHLGQNDIDPLQARTELGETYLIGGTANTLTDCQKLIQKQVNYIGLGPFRFTKTKINLSPILGHRILRGKFFISQGFMTM